jgi:hypothetical protein
MFRIADSIQADAIRSRALDGYMRFGYRKGWKTPKYTSNVNKHTFTVAAVKNSDMKQYTNDKVIVLQDAAKRHTRSAGML